MKLTEYEHASLKKLDRSIVEGRWSNEALVQLIELAGQYLNIATIPEYCRRNGLSYNGAKKFRAPQKILGVTFIIDNQ